MNAASSNGSFTIVGLGEAVFDVFPDKVVLGGTSLNLSVHAQQLLAPHGGRGVLLSRIGTDDLGRQLLSEFKSRRLPVDNIQLDHDKPTGRVLVRFHDGEPHYEIVRDVAWDALAFGQAEQSLAASCHAICFGTLAQRDARSRASIRAILRAAPQAVRLFDVNLRQDFFDAEIISESCALATVVKLNEAELPVVAKLLALPNAEPAAQMETLRARFNLRAAVLTRGERGTAWFDASGTIEADVPRFEPALGADSVGAGDACSAGLLAGLLGGLSPRDVVALANRLGAFVASQPGATPNLPPSFAI